MSRLTTKGYFVKERLTQARDAREITQSGLAKLLQRSGSTISNWERGEQAPEPHLIRQLADHLNVAPGYFLRPVPDHGSNAIFFRSFATAAARARAREKARMRWLQHVSLTLQETLVFPAVNLPTLVERGDYKRLKEVDLENIAADLRQHWRLGESRIVSALLVVENAGVIVGIDEVGTTKIHGQSNWSDYDGRPYILLARDKYTAFGRQMDVSHELAHLVLHRGIDEEELEQNFDTIEYQSKYLACALLLPHRSFASEIFSLSLDGFLSLKSRWKVSVGAMIMRAHHLDILNDESAQRLWKYRATRGWHRREPLDLPSETPVEGPRLLRRSIEMLVSERVRSKKDLLETDICLGAQDVEMLTSLPVGFFSENANVVPLEPCLKERKASNKRASKASNETASIVPFMPPS